MKLLIEQDLNFSWSAPPDLAPAELAEELEYYRELEQLAKRYSISRRFSFRPSGVDITVLAQKVTLDEVSMNTLFADFLNELFLLETCYAALGGAGCEFALDLVNAVPRKHG